MSVQQEAAKSAHDLVAKVNEAILFPLIALLSGVAFLFFIYGCAEYIMNASNDTARETGKKHIMYGLIGLVIMLSAFAILSLAANTFGLGKQLDCAKNPTASGCDAAFQVR